MPRATIHQLEDALARAAAAAPSDPVLRDPLVRSARAIVEARRAVREGERCPPSVLRRVEGFYAARPRGRLGALLALVFDTGLSPAPAVRGARRPPRTVRFAGGGGTVDLQVRTAADGRRVLHVAVSPPRPGVVADLRVSPRGRKLRIGLDAEASGEAVLPAGATTAHATFRTEGGAIFRVRGIPLA